MRKRLLAIAICAVLVSTVAATSAVSAAKQSTIRKFDLAYPYEDEDGNELWAICGKVTVDVETGHITINMNGARLQEVYDATGVDAKTKDLFKEFYRKVPDDAELTLALFNWDPYQVVYLGDEFVSVNDGGNVHVEGTITDTAALNTISGWSTDAHLYLYVIW